MEFYKIKPESAAQLGKYTEYIKSTTPWKITKLHVIFDVWLGGDILRTSPCYFVSNTLYDKFKAEELKGLDSMSEVMVDTSNTFKNLYPHRILPKFYLLNISGVPLNDDLGMTDKLELVISKKVLKILEEVDISNSKLKLMS